MLRSGETKVANKEFYGTQKAINMWDVNVNNIFISKLAETKNN